jgi:hypothetical protein
MKKVAGIVAVVAFAAGIFATQTEIGAEFAFDIENALACDDCGRTGDGSRNGNT